MISFIICSIHPEQAQATVANIKATVGFQDEYIVIDNRQNQHSIAKAYNEGASHANGEVLCFVHEDVRFHTNNFGPIIYNKVLEPKTGVIGFAGTFYKAKAPSGWSIHDDLTSKYMIQTTRRKSEKCIAHDTSHDGFTHVIAVDGFCMFTSHSAWASHPFDEQAINGFHCYDVDFCIGMHIAGLKNYVCHLIMPEHMSSGNYNTQWIDNTLLLHHGKWKELLPLYTQDISLSIEQQAFYEHCAWYDFLKQCVKSTIPSKQLWDLTKEAITGGLPRSLIFKLFYKTIYYRLLARRRH